ncbi:HAMP domain-containing protein [Trinickia violacea]|uniref:HAMP domain-containing protein n=1 Tax=Trinickia violacea TaxID=2571746 RepID=A0A4P8IZN2_9BURK|nr:methyl-accepting chemotaxis protein [Trinickia violacea]QCP54071.1 HAMP domain-containing protein [Trinickia violacea]
MIVRKTVRGRMLQTLASLSFLMLCGSMLGIWGEYRDLAAMQKIYLTDASGTELLLQIKADSLDVIAILSSLATFAESERPARLRKVAVALKAVDRNRDQYLAIANGSQRREQAAAFSDRLDRFRAFLDNLQTIQAITDPASRAQKMGEGKAAYNAFHQSLETLIDDQRRDANLRFNDSKTGIQHHIVLLAALGLCSMIVALVSYVSLTRKVIVPLTTAAEDCERIAAGNLETVRPQESHSGEIGRLFDAFERMQSILRDIVGDVRSGSESVAGATAQIVAGNVDLSQRTEEQAASIEAIVADLNEFAGRAQRNSLEATKALRFASEVEGIAIGGRSEMDSVVSTMDLIVKSSRRMNEIIGTIESLSFQTNILALNAAVESARAGEHGRGFAVVAAEVRSLAKRSALAAREIGEMIRTSSNEIDRGSQRVQAAGLKMAQISDAVRETSGIMREIAEVSSAQNDDIIRTQSALDQIEQTTQRNAALVEQASAAAASLRDDAARLARTMQFFASTSSAPMH